MKRIVLFAAMWMAWASVATAQPVIDGALDQSVYGAALSIQNTDTGFGNAAFQMDPVNSGGGSEIDQVFGAISGGRLHVLITGNLEMNFNKLMVFVDSVSGGVNQLVGANLPTQFDPFCGRCGGGFPPPEGNGNAADGGLQNMNGLTFDAGFDADYVLAFTHGTENGGNPLPDFWAMSAHYAELNEGTAGNVAAAGIVLAPQGMPTVLRKAGEGFGDPPATPNGFDADGVDTTLYGPALPGLSMGELIDRNYALTQGGCLDDTGAGCITQELEFVLDVDPAEIGGATPNASNHRNFNNTIGLQMAIDNSNNAGVDGLNPAFPDTIGNPQDVTTGVEFSIPLASIGNPTGDVKLTIFVNGSDYDHASNQFSGTGLLRGNLGSDGNGNHVNDQLMANLSTIAGDQFVTVAAPPGVPADYNGNGTVDAADYTVWRDNLGGASLPNEGGISPGVVDEADYDFWKSRFGATSGSGSLAAAGVPEPSAAVLVVIGTLMACAFRGRK